MVVGCCGRHDRADQVPPEVLHYKAVQPSQDPTDGLVGEVLQVLEQVNRELRGTGREGRGRTGREQGGGDREGEDREREGRIQGEKEASESM